MGLVGFWLVLAPLVAGLVVLWRCRPAGRRAALDRFARHVELPVPPGRRPDLERLLLSRTLATDLGGMGGIVVAAAWLGAAGSPLVDGALFGPVLIAAALAGATLGAGLTAARQAVRRPDPAAPRVARPRAATLSDYLAPVELQGARVAAPLPALLLLVAVAAAATSDPIALADVVGAGAVAAAALGLAALAGSELVGRRLVEQPQPAGSDLELAWSDALRARVLRDLVTAPIVVGTYATVGVLGALDGAVGDGALRTAGVGLVVLLALALIAVGLTSAWSRPHRHFRRRLWPEPPADPTPAGEPT